MLSEVSTTART